MPGPNTITPAQLDRLIGLPDAPLILDVRVDEDFTADPHLIPASRRMVAQTVTVPDGFRGRVVVQCQRGAKLSEGAAALLRARGHAAETLEGGWLAWRAAGLPVIDHAALQGAHLWVTRQRPKIDRIACPWLIRRFLNREAQFLFVAPATVADVADRFSAIPFDIEGVPYSHVGEACTFDTMLARFGLQSGALSRMATVIRAADTDRHDLAPQAAGLLAISVGLSRQYRDDLQQLTAGMALYDALYLWARDGFDEGHDWPAARKT